MKALDVGSLSSSAVHRAHSALLALATMASVNWLGSADEKV
jgi:hypothetical protein